MIREILYSHLEQIIHRERKGEISQVKEKNPIRDINGQYFPLTNLIVNSGPRKKEIWSTYDGNKRREERNSDDDLFTSTQGLNEKFPWA